MNTEKSEVTVIDAVMGTGKSTWAIAQVIQNTHEKYVIAVPTLPEVERYKDKIGESRGVYAPHVDMDSPEDVKTKTEDFRRAVQRGEGVIITTHSLFSLWDAECINLIAKQGYTGILDETVDLVQEAHIAEQDYQMLLHSGYITEESYKGKHNVKSIGSTDKTEGYTGKFDTFIKQALRNNLIKVRDAMYIRTIKPENITKFKECFILTYMYPGSLVDCWFRMYELEVTIKTLVRDADTGKHVLMEHTGEYSGKQFKHLIALVETPGMNTVGKKGRTKGIPLSNGAFEKLTPAEWKKLQANLANMARHKTQKFMKGNMCDDSLHPAYYFMWSSKLEHRSTLEEGMPYKQVPKSAPLGFKEGHQERVTDRECYVTHNQRATNDYSHKAVLAYITTPLPRVPLKSLFTDLGYVFNSDIFMLSTLLQWVWRSRIRIDETILLWIPSEPLRELFKRWLSGVQFGPI